MEIKINRQRRNDDEKRAARGGMKLIKNEAETESK
jgi:hypothetical protein